MPAVGLRNLTRPVAYDTMPLWNCRLAAWSLSDEGSDVMVRYDELFQLGLLIVAVIALCLKKRKK